MKKNNTIASLMGLAVALVALGGVLMGLTYRKEAEEVRKYNLNDTQLIAHCEGIEKASYAASAGVGVIGFLIYEFLINALDGIDEIRDAVTG